MRSDAAPAVAKGTNSTFGIFEVDNSTIIAPGSVLSVANSGVTPGSYTNANITVNAQGQLTAASSGSGTNPNTLRDSGLTDWFSGTSGTVPTTAGATSWTAEGVFAVATGATLPWAQQASDLASPLSYYSVKFTGAASNTDLKVRFVVESYTAARLAGQTVTFQIPIYNNTGSSLTPTLSTEYPSAQDNWTSSSTDLSSTNLQACASGATCTEAYTLTVSASAKNGYEFVVDFGALSSNTKTIEIGGGFDARPTPGVSTGLNASPPAPFIADPSETSAWDRRFYQTSYDNGTSPGSSTHAGMVQLGYTPGSTVGLGSIFQTPLRTSPTITFWDGAGNLGKYSYYTGSWVDNQGAITGIQYSTKSFVITSGGTAGDAVFVQYAADARIAGN